MAKAKQKKIKKELDKLQRAGRYLEWLVEVQGQPLTPELKREQDQAWQEVQRRALRTPQAFEDFIARIDQLREIPETPELAFLLALKGVTTGMGEAEETLLGITGLTGTALVAQKNIRVALGTARDWPGINDLLALIAREPGKITRRHYQDLAVRCTGTVLALPFTILADGMAVFRRLNHKANLHKPLAARFLDELDLADHHLSQAIEFFPPALQRLALLPFLSQILLHLRQCDPPPAAQQVRALVQAVEWTFLRGTGHLVPEALCRQLLDDDELLPTAADLKKMAADFAAAPFEGKLVLLRDLRQALDTAAAQGPGIDFFFGDFFEDNEVEAMARLLLRFHVQLVKEIGSRLPTLPPREGRALVAALDPILAKDVGDLVVVLGDRQPLLDLLLQAAEAGCLGTRLALLAYLLSMEQSKRLGPLALAVLTEGPAPVQEDLHWLMREHGRLVLRAPALLKVLFDRIRGNGPLVGSLVKALCAEIKTFAPPGNKAPQGHPPGATAAERLPAAVRDGLVELAGQVAELEPLQRYLTSPPGGRVNAESLRKRFEQLWQQGAYAPLVAMAQEYIPDDSGPSQLADLLSGLGSPEKVAADVNRALFTLELINFLRQQADDFRRIPLAGARLLVETLYPLLQESANYSSLLIRTSNALGTRVSAGDSEFVSLRDTLDQRLRRMAAGQRGSGRPPKR